MSLESWKSAYLQLSPADRKALAKWIVEQELGSATAGPVPVSGGASWKLPGAAAKALLGFAGATVILGGAWFGWSVYQSAKEEEARKTQAEREAEEARRPRSPTNLDFLRQNVGREVTVTGVPQAYEVGFLFFHKDPRRALRLNLISGGVVLLQSTELAELVQNQVEVTVTGVVEATEEGFLEIKVQSVGQLQRRDRR